jgi:hypothetical protein
MIWPLAIELHLGDRDVSTQRSHLRLNLKLGQWQHEQGRRVLLMRSGKTSTSSSRPGTDHFVARVLFIPEVMLSQDIARHPAFDAPHVAHYSNASSTEDRFATALVVSRTSSSSVCFFQSLSVCVGRRAPPPQGLSI